VERWGIVDNMSMMYQIGAIWLANAVLNGTLIEIKDGGHICFVIRQKQVILPNQQFLSEIRTTILNSKQNVQETRQFWNKQADTFDDEPDHGLRDPIIREAWAKLLKESLPSSSVSVLDIGCGTGSLSLVLAALNHQVMGIDLSEAMIAQAKTKAKAAGHPISFEVMDAFAPRLPGQQFEVIVCRHLLWALPDPAVALQRWAELLLPGGRILLVEGFWKTGVGLHSEQVVAALPATFTAVKVENLSANEALWGKKVSDERYMIIAEVRDVSSIVQRSV